MSNTKSLLALGALLSALSLPNAASASPQGEFPKSEGSSTYCEVVTPTGEPTLMSVHISWGREIPTRRVFGSYQAAHVTIGGPRLDVREDVFFDNLGTQTRCEFRSTRTATLAGNYAKIHFSDFYPHSCGFEGSVAKLILSPGEPTESEYDLLCQGY